MSLQLVPSSPGEVGLPPKIGSWRAGQAEVIEEGIMNEKRVFSPCAGTGFGKTGFYVGQALLEGGRTVFVVQNNGLLDQLYDDFKSIGLVTIKGKSNYVCGGGVDWTCRDGHAGGCTLKGSNLCPHTKAYNAARTKPLVATNYKLWIAVHKYGLGLGRIDRVVFDEAQSCPNELADSLTVPLSYHEMEMLKSDFPVGRRKDSSNEWKVWATKQRILAQEKFNQQQNKVRSSRDPKRSWIQDLHHYRNMVQKFSMVATMRPGDWVWEESEQGFTFDPIKFGRYAESRLLLKIPKITMTSATIRPKTAHMLHIKKEDLNFQEIPSSFPAWRSPIYSVPTMRVDRRSSDYSMLVIRADQVMGPRLNADRNGLIYVSSFGYRDVIYHKSFYGGSRGRILSHFDGDPASMAVKRFKKMGGVLISPSISTGYDFPDDECRFTIMTKIPWLPTNSKIVKARQELDKDFGAYHAFQKIIQFVGRGDRSEDDWCENFILDDHFSQWFFKAFGYLAPQSFKDRYREVLAVPRMLEV